MELKLFSSPNDKNALFIELHPVDQEEAFRMARLIDSANGLGMPVQFTLPDRWDSDSQMTVTLGPVTPYGKPEDSQ